MTIIPEQQTLDRWDALPDVLRQALFSEDNSHIIIRACEEEHIPNEKVYLVLRITGYVLLGFLHPEDVAREVADALEINRRIAESIAATLNTKIFRPLKSDLERIYAPAVQVGGPSTFSTSGMPEEIKTSDEDVDKILLKIQGLTSASEMPPMQNATKPTEGPPAEPPEPPPFFLHEESGPAPITSKPGFHLDISQEKFGEVKAELDASRGLARIEVGNEAPFSPAAVKTEPPKPRIVHYGTWRTPLQETSGEAIPPATVPTSGVTLPQNTVTPAAAESQPKVPEATIISLNALGGGPTKLETAISTTPDTQKEEALIKKTGSPIFQKMMFWKKSKPETIAAEPITPKPEPPKTEASQPLLVPPRAPEPTQESSSGNTVDLRSLEQLSGGRSDSTNSEPGGGLPKSK